MATDLLSLKSNPIFQLSLASKELFHSNFLFWLSQDVELEGLFKKIINFLCGDDSIWDELKDGFVVLREYKNFDLCICKKKEIKEEEQPENANSDPTQNSEDTFKEDEKIAGEIVFVLENKFKSIATAGQLRKYVEKTLEYNVPILKKSVLSDNGRKKWINDDNLFGELQNKFNESKHIFVLLTLAKDFAEIDAINEINTFNCDKDGKIVETNNGSNNGNESNNSFVSKDNKWIIKNYEEYAKFLKKNNESSTNSLPYQIIDKYQEFISIFSSKINDRLKEIKSGCNWNEIFDEENKKNREYKSIRCSDIWQKMAMHKIAQELIKKVKNKIQGISEFVIDTDSSDKHCRECSDDYNNFSKTIFIGVQYFHSLALLEIKYRINKDCMFVIQQQGKSLCAGIDILQNRNTILNISRKNKKWSDTVDKKLFQKYKLIYILTNFDKYNVLNKPYIVKAKPYMANNKLYMANISNKYYIVIDSKKPYIIYISNKSNGEIPAYENEKGGFYYKNIILNPSENSKDNGDSTINDTLDYMVDCLNRAIKEFPPKK